jgi:hypothetical protein
MPIPSWLTRPVAYAIGALVLIVVVLIVLSQCSSGQRAKVENRVNKGEAQAAIDSGSEAIATASAVIASENATDAQVEAAQAAVASAAAGQKGKTAKREACRFKAYKDTPQCKEPNQ